MALIRCIVALCLSLCIYFVVEVGLMLIVGIWVAWFGWIGRLWVLWLDQIGGLEFGWLWVGWIGWRWVDAWVVWCGGGVVWLDWAVVSSLASGQVCVVVWGFAAV